jgi:hypothetical protein
MCKRRYQDGETAYEVFVQKLGHQQRSNGAGFGPREIDWVVTTLTIGWYLDFRLRLEAGSMCFKIDVYCPADTEGYPFMCELCPHLRSSCVARLIRIVKDYSERCHTQHTSHPLERITLRLFVSRSILYILRIKQYHYSNPFTHCSLSRVALQLSTIVRHADFRAHT